VAVKRRLWQRLLATRVDNEQGLQSVDCFAVPVRSFARVPRDWSFARVAPRLRRHDEERLPWLLYPPEGRLAGVIVEDTLAPADVHDRWVAGHDLLVGVGQGATVVGDTGYRSPALREEPAGCRSG
jgi:hypothetical protein